MDETVANVLHAAEEALHAAIVAAGSHVDEAAPVEPVKPVANADILLGPTAVGGV